MKKNVKKIISSLFSNGNTKENLKLLFYNLNFKGVKFSLNSGVYCARYKGVEYHTTRPIYVMTNEFKNYTHFYLPKQSDVVLDAGANQGIISLYFASLLNDEGVIWAFEPDRKNIETISENLRLNKEYSFKIKIQDLLLWNKNMLIDFCEAGTVGSSVHYISDKEKVIKKQAVSIDNWVVDNNIERLDFIKMDIEGAEIEALEGAVETIKRLSPNFAIASYHIINGEPTYIKLEKFFESINYPYKTVKFEGNEIITFAGLSILNKKSPVL